MEIRYVKKLSLYGPREVRGSRMLRPPEFPDNRHIKVARLLTLRTGHFYPQEISLVLIF
jgi:hypothetical protein